MSTEAKTYTLTQLHVSIENWVRKTFSVKQVWITCQIAKANEKNGHYYLELVDSKDGLRTAQAKGMIWRTSFGAIQKQLASFDLKTSDVLKEGLEIKCLVTVNFHKVYGMSLVISQIDPSILLGDIEKQKAETRKRLEKEGLYPLQKELYFGPIIKRIALIGSPETSGFEDFMNELMNNDIFTNFKIKIFPVGVQSQEAVDEITNAIQEANLYDVDAIAIVRGGGSKMDLHIFNSYAICSASARSRIPIITGIGHESDNCLIDEVAHTSMKTPTAAAKLFYMNIGVFASSLSNTSKHIQLQVRELLSQSSGELQFYSGILYERVDEIIQVNDLALKKQDQSLQYSFKTYLSDTREALNESLHQLQYVVFSSIQIELSQLDTLGSFLGRTIETYLQEIATKELQQVKDLLFIRAQFVLRSSQDYLEFCTQKLGLVDPNQLFEKGYTISTIDGKDINNIKGELIQKEMTTHSSGYSVLSTVKKIISKK